MNELKETIDNAPVRAFLVCADTGEYDAERSMQELKQLAETAGVDTVAQVLQKRPSYDSATCIGSGRLAELAEEAKAQDIELIIFDSELTANQTKNIEAVTDIRVMRSMIVPYGEELRIRPDVDIYAGQRLQPFEPRLSE